VALEEHPERFTVTGAGTRPQNRVIDFHRLFMSDQAGRVPAVTAGTRHRARRHTELFISSAIISS
jgi:hypothetical protein